MINNLKDLVSLFEKCREAGITEIRVEDIYIKFGDLPVSSDLVETDIPEITNPYDLIYYSVGNTDED